MKRRETEVTEEAEETTDIVGTTITVWCAVLICVLMWVE